MPFYILAIESSCDETSAAVICDGKVISNSIATQIEHAKYGGVIPELASRAHQTNLIHVVKLALSEVCVSENQLSAIAFTQGPGLIGSLMVGCTFAKSFAMALSIPLIAVNHMHAHVLSHFIDDPKPEFPFLCLIVSGGHTQIVLVKQFDNMIVVGQTSDDAAGEAFDKIAKLLGFEYPGGPQIDKHATYGNENRFKFPEPKVEGLNFSFSGLKTAVINFLNHETKNESDFISKNVNDIAASVQLRINSILISKLKKAAKEYGIHQIAIAGGVAANKGLRKLLLQQASENQWKIFIPEFQYCTDNAAMIAMAAWYKFLKNDFCSLDTSADARLPF